MDVFVYDRIEGLTYLASVTNSGGQGDGDSILPALSEDGRFVLFTSSASNLVDADANGTDDAFVVDFNKIAAPTWPADASVSLGGFGATVSLSWTPAVDNFGVAGYKIDRSVDGSNWTHVDTTTATDYTHEVPPADQKKTWYYRITAYDAAGNSSVGPSREAFYVPDVRRRPLLQTSR